jgi:outer membrane protein assembly factor BamE (lipoprotein component of BamABCDE complex)
MLTMGKKTVLRRTLISLGSLAQLSGLLLFYWIYYFLLYDEYGGFTRLNVVVLLLPLLFFTFVHVVLWIMVRNKWYRAALLLLEAVVITVFSIHLTFISIHESKSHYNKERWVHATDFSGDRFYMLDEVTQLIQGKTRQEVIELLGAPTKTSYFNQSERNMVYVLGPERGFIRIDYEWLIIEFDDNGVFARYSTTTD